MHSGAYGFVARTVLTLPPRRAVVEFGSLDINGSVRPLFSGARYVGVDCREGPCVDAVEDAATFTPPWEPDTVVCCEVLEHAENAPQIIENAARILPPRGVFIVTCATDPRQPHSGLDGSDVQPGEFYQNVDEKQLVEWLLEHFENAYTDGQEGDLWAVAWK